MFLSVSGEPLRCIDTKSFIRVYLLFSQVQNVRTIVNKTSIFIDISIFLSNLFLFIFCISLSYIRRKMDLIFSILFSILFQRALSANMACQEVRYAYSARGINVYDVPLTPQLGKTYFINL